MAINFPKLLKLAQIASQKSTHKMYKVGAVIIDRTGRPISFGTNSASKTHPLVRLIGKTPFGQHKNAEALHAEIAALISIRHKVDTRGLKILVYRENNKGELRMARPCEICNRILKAYGIDGAYFTTDGGIEYEKVA